MGKSISSGEGGQVALQGEESSQRNQSEVALRHPCDRCDKGATLELVTKFLSLYFYVL